MLLMCYYLYVPELLLYCFDVKTVLIPSQVPPPVPKKPNVLLLPSSVHSSTNGSTERQTPQTDSPVGHPSPVGAFSPEEFPSTSRVPDVPDQDENHLPPPQEGSKDSSLQLSLHDSSLTELGGKMASTGIGSGMFLEENVSRLGSQGIQKV